MVTYREYKQEQDRIAREEARQKVSRDIDKQVSRTQRGLFAFGRRVGSSIQRGLKSSTQRPQQRLSTGLVRSFSGQGQRQSQSQGQRPVGRPRGDYKHRDPKTGQPIPATEYYKRIKEVKREAGQMARMNRIQQIQELGKRGIPPSQAAQIVDSRTEQRIQTKLQPQVQQVQTRPQVQQVQQVQQRPNMMASRVPRNIPRYGERRVFIEADLFGNPREKVSNDETSFWN